MKAMIVVVALGIALVAGLVTAGATNDVNDDPAFVLAKQCSQQLHMCASGARGWEMLAGAGR